MYPVVIGNGRNLQSDAIINGFHVPKGTHVIFPHFVVSNLEEYFPEPHRFIPERWIKRDANLDQGINIFAHVFHNIVILFQS